MQPTEQTVMVAFDPNTIQRIHDGHKQVAGMIEEMKELIKNHQKYYHLPDWVDASTALTIDEVPFTTTESLRTWEGRGVVRTRPYSADGRRKLYSKEDCINFLDRRDAWKRGTLKD